MNTCVSRGLWGVLFVGGLSLLGVGTANAAETSGDDSLLGGNQAIVSVNAPVTVHGNAISLVGDSKSSDATTTAPGSGGSQQTATTSGDSSVLGGNQAVVSVDLPVTVNGNAVSVIGDSTSENATTVVKAPAGTSGEPVSGAESGGDRSVLGGNQLLADVSLPGTVNGNAISGIGDRRSEDATTLVHRNDAAKPTKPVSGGTEQMPGTACEPATPRPADNGKHHDPQPARHTTPATGGAWTHQGTNRRVGSKPGQASWKHHDRWSPADEAGQWQCNSDERRARTSGDYSLVGGNQLIADVSAPVTVNGNAVSVIGDSTSEDATTVVRESDGVEGGSAAITSGNHSLLGGNQLIADVSAPVTVNGNAVSVLGDSTSEDAATILQF